MPLTSRFALKETSLWTSNRPVISIPAAPALILLPLAKIKSPPVILTFASICTPSSSSSLPICVSIVNFLAFATILLLSSSLPINRLFLITALFPITRFCKTFNEPSTSRFLSIETFSLKLASPLIPKVPLTSRVFSMSLIPKFIPTLFSFIIKSAPSPKTLFSSILNILLLPSNPDTQLFVVFLYLVYTLCLLPLISSSVKIEFPSDLRCKISS